MSVAKVVLALRNEIYCIGLEKAIQANFKDRLTVAGSAHFSREIEKTCSGVTPDILIIDTVFLEGDCFEMISEIKKRFCNIKVIGVSEYYRLETAMNLNKSGACGYFSYDDNRITMLDLIERVLNLPVDQERYDFQVSIQ